MAEEDNKRLIKQDFEGFLESMRQNLSEDENFKDYNYEGSHISTLLRQLAYVAENLSYMTNVGASEAHISLTKMYENANSLSKALSYSPKGHLAALVDSDIEVAFGISSEDPDTWYTGVSVVIPRYTNFKTTAVNPTNGDPLYYTAYEDIVLSPGIDYEILQQSFNAGGGTQAGAWTFSGKLPLVNGFYRTITANSDGSAYQQIKLPQPSDAKKIGDGYVDVYVYSESLDSYQQWERVSSLKDYGPTDNVFELRYNEFRQYEITFGDGINGQIPTAGTENIQIYRLTTDHLSGSIGGGFLSDTTIMNEIEPELTIVRTTAGSPNKVIPDPSNPTINSLPYVNISGVDAIQISTTDFKDTAGYETGKETLTNTPVLSDPTIFLKITQNIPSTIGGLPETTSEIKMNAPRTFSTQGTLSTTPDYQAFYDTEHTGIIHDSYLMNNNEYMTTFMAEYFATGGYGIENPNTVKILGGFRSGKDRVLQMDSCDFNNMYAVVVPKVGEKATHPVKERLIRSTQDNKTATSEVVILDPVYSYCVPYISVNRQASSNVTRDYITLEIKKLVLAFYERAVSTLGENIDLEQLKTDVLSINGVDTIEFFGMVVSDGVDLESTDLDENNFYFKARDYDEISGGDGFILTSSNLKLKPFKFKKLSNLYESLFADNCVVDVITNALDSVNLVEY